ncbi:sensor histidine kinase [[Phormidium ambiguum] IAM M-71]|nr:HAMP domain-containing sensor histidine kinase [Phormidium ambiguum]
MQSICNFFKTNLVRQRSASIVFSLSLQMVGIFIIGLISVNFGTIAQINQQMTSTSVESLWHIGMCSFITTMVFVLPLLVGAIVFVILRSLRPLQTLTEAIVINSFEQHHQTNFKLTKIPVEILPLLKIYNKLVSTISETGIQQQQFIATLSHELRTSLSLISGYLQYISRCNINLTKNQQEALDIVNIESEHIIQILQDSLELARVKNYCLPINLESLVLNDVVHEAVRISEKLHHWSIQVDTNSEKIIIKADRYRLLQVLIHLIDYAKPGGESTIKLEQKDDLVKIKVSNTSDNTLHKCSVNLGISQTSHQPINLSDTHSQENLNLKLEIINTLVKRMGGNVFGKYHPGQGSEFWIRFSA